MQLTKTEREIVQALSDGKTSTEIAAIRFRSVETVRAHIKHARGKLGAKTIGQLVKLSMHQGLIHSIVFALVISSVATVDPNRRRLNATRSFSFIGRVIRAREL